MHRELAEQKRWISEKRFLHALNYCMLLPGPEAQQLATYIGWLMHRTLGGVVAGALFVLPSLFILIGSLGDLASVCNQACGSGHRFAGGAPDWFQNIEKTVSSPRIVGGSSYEFHSNLLL